VVKSKIKNPFERLIKNLIKRKRKTLTKGHTAPSIKKRQQSTAKPAPALTLSQQHPAPPQGNFKIGKFLSTFLNQSNPRNRYSTHSAASSAQA
jgi:hypothetical protein